MNPDDLDQKADAELNELFAVEVAGWRFHKADPSEKWVTLHQSWWIAKEPCDRRGSDLMFVAPHLFCTDANAVLPWLERRCALSRLEVVEVYPAVPEHNFKTQWNVTLIAKGALGSTFNIYATAPTFARAAVLALIRSKRPST